jgi:protein-S-isoprenylcysteine O-methyltransferase Ste14
MNNFVHHAHRFGNNRRDMKRIEQEDLEKSKLIVRTLLNCFLVLIFFGVPLFLPAGTLQFWNGWLFLGLFDACFFLILIYFALKNPEYVKKRFKGEEKETPQKIVMSLLILSALSTLAVAGFNHRFHWSTVPLILVIVFTVATIGGFVMLFMVMKQNSYTSRVIEIQEDQKVIDTGMYSIVRHPMYLAFSIIFCFSPFILGSWYSLVTAACIPLLVTYRIRNEEEVLKAGLAGYDSYMQKVKYRLIPYVW